MSKHRSKQPPQIEADTDREYGGTVAVDIECINLVPAPDLRFDDPTHWTLFCIPIGYRAPDGTVETDVLFRPGASLCEERDLIDRMLEWIRDRKPTELLTYNGEFYDEPILRYRARVSTRECRGHHDTNDNLELVLDALTHVDLFQVVKEQAGFNVPLESALKYHEIPDEPTYLDGEEISGADMPDLGLRILSGDVSKDEVRAVREYAESDVEPLFELADAVLNDE